MIPGQFGPMSLTPALSAIIFACLAHEQDKQKWAGKMKIWLEKVNKAVNQDGGELNNEKAKQFLLEYRKLLSEAEIECTSPDEKERNEKR